MKRSDALKLGVVLLLWLLVIAPVVPEMVRTWLGHSDNTHSLLVPFISLYFAWAKRKELAGVESSGSLWGGFFLVASLALYLVSYLGGVAFVSRLMIVCSLIGLVWNCFGWRMLRELAFPLGFLFFMVPVPESLLGFVSFPLQMLATTISAWGIKLLSIPVYQEGNMLYFVQTQLEVAEACSGIRSIMALTMLSVLMANLSSSPWRHKALLVACAIPIAMLANILRVTGTGVLAHFFGDKVARGFLHDFSGFAIFLFGFVCMVALSGFMESIHRSRTTTRDENRRG